ncbi:autotransporter assembly complex protein TamA [Pontiella sulfatireligans]|uniref:Translocation and assembly module TamA n=1 Tax=Pontiella sulfatireligans TaxID=2750658 RepID=A0A6C2UIV6_9BACT|nr:BamA/TamA family outer membrane protein [Pontiella sulfatireligans]VGO19813.1 Translocation and assembly module TamA [Pontiella sulfatireligans]
MNLRFNKGLVLFFLLALTGLAIFADSPTVAYKPEMQGAGDRAVKNAVKASAQTFRLVDRPPATIGQLRRRVEKDLPMIGKVLESRGYYEGRVASEINQDKDPVRARFNVELGPQYAFGEIQFQFTNNTDAAVGKIPPRLKKGAGAVAEDMFAEERRVLSQLQRIGYPFPALGKRSVEVDREHRRVNVALVFDPGVCAFYGGLEVEGLESLDVEYMERILPWKTGDKYDSKQVSELERKLLSSGLFGTARVALQPQPQGSNSIPVKITASERDLRTIRFGVGYSDIGASAKVIWEHRNLFGSGENFRTEFNYSPIEYRVNSTLERPGFFRASQSLILGLEASRKEPDAYHADQLISSAIVKREFTRYIMGGSGLRYKYSKVDQLDATEEFSYLILPVFCEFDNRNDKLNPVRGVQFFASSSYYEDLNGKASFVKTELEGRAYKMLWKGPRLSTALRLAFGSIDGAAVENIPADERFYAGGGGSVRGYEYQKIGPQVGDTPVGGSQVAEYSVELRLQPGKNLGYAAFIDGGAIYNDLADHTDRDFRHGAGLGLRYFTGIGPLRVDFAYPLNPTDEQEKKVQFYISLGQAF